MKEILVQKNGENVGIYPSVAFASKKLKISETTIRGCLKTGKQAFKAFTFDYPLEKK